MKDRNGVKHDELAVILAIMAFFIVEFILTHGWASLIGVLACLLVFAFFVFMIETLIPRIPKDEQNSNSDGVFNSQVKKDIEFLINQNDAINKSISQLNDRIGTAEIAVGFIHPEKDAKK